MNTFEFKEIPYFTWRNEPATDKQKIAILDMWEFSHCPLPTLNLKTLTKGEWVDYINKYYFLAHENVNSPTFGY